MTLANVEIVVDEEAAPELVLYRVPKGGLFRERTSWRMGVPEARAVAHELLRACETAARIEEKFPHRKPDPDDIPF